MSVAEAASPPVKAARRHYWAGLDGLRALAVVAVLLYHLGRPEARGGYLGVDVFFALSGFLITDLLLREHRRTGAISWRAFYGRRALRLFPALCLVALVALVLALSRPAESWSDDTLDGLPFVALYVGNWARAFGDEHTLGLLVHTWSLAIEEQFYLVWPLVVAALARRRVSSRAWVLLLLSAAAASACWRAVLTLDGASGVRTASGLDSHADGLLLGAALAVMVGALQAPPSAAVRRLLGGAAVAAGGCLVALLCLMPGTDAGALYGYTSASLLTCVVVAGLATSSVPQVTRLLEWRPVRWVGVRSYGLYLWHFPLFLVLADRDHGPVPGSILAVVTTVLVAATSYRFLEQPFLRLKGRLH